LLQLFDNYFFLPGTVNMMYKHGFFELQMSYIAMQYCITNVIFSYFISSKDKHKLS